VSGCVNVEIANRDKSFGKNINVLVVKKITDLVPQRKIEVSVEVSNGVELADYRFNFPDKIDILLGAEVFYELIRSEQIYYQNSNLIMQNTVFGYVASGCVEQESGDSILCGLIKEEDLNVTLKRFWEVEGVEDKLTKSKENILCEEHFVRTHRRGVDGKYVVTMPLKENPTCLGQSRDIALKKLRSLWTRLSKDKHYLNLYRDFLNEYKNLGHMREVVEENLPEVAYYATHHGVYKPERNSTKLRVVFNCSSPTTNGTSLNSLQYNGGVIQEDLFSLMVGFRRHIFALTADVKMMYRMILLDPSQHCLQRILWSDNPDEPPKTFELLTVTYGTVSAPFLAMRTLQQLSVDEECNFPKAAPVVREKFYMDDVLYGAPTIEEAKELQSQLIGIMQKAGMQLHKWCANHIELSQSAEGYNFYNQTETKTLGVSWNPKEDCFNFKVKIELSDSYTKRHVLSTIARIFDPLGLLGPIIAKAKIFMQGLWRLKTDWCDSLPTEEFQEWHRFLLLLESINNINIERLIVIEEATVIEIHGFSDASERCYGAVVYCKSENSSGKTLVKLISSKSRVAPIKSLTIPKLELCAAVLLSKLTKKVLAALKLSVNQVFLWSDSMIVLSWLQREPIDLKTFVQNRVAKIQELSAIDQWHHIPSDQNPADVLSRGVDPDKLLNHKLWWKGPDFLSTNVYPHRTISVSERCIEYNSELKNFPKQDLEYSVPVFSVTLNYFVHEIINLSNNYITILRILSYVFRFVTNLKNPLARRSGPLDSTEFKKAENFLISAVQRVEFPSDFHNVKSTGSVLPNSKLKSFNPFLDDDEVLRVGGRLGNTNFNFEKKHPAILPKNHKLTIIIILYFHVKYLHINSYGLLNCVREKFWPISGRTTCRKVVYQCIKCFKAKPVISTQLMGNLPKDRVTPDYPFNCSGVDLCGPFFIKIKTMRRSILQKVYICIFVCFVFKAVHLEIVSDLTSESFIAALKRFVARRGKCAKLYSDNATNFVGANREIKKFQELVKRPDEKLASYLSVEGIDWKFIPPRSPNFGGLWEAAIKSFKYHYKRIVGNANLTYEELLTITVQIEGVLNSRPLSPLSDNEENFEVLTPAHFLINRSINSIIEPDLTQRRDNQLKRWQRITKIVQSIWRKWHRNYLSELQQRNKWRFDKQNVRIGDLVLLVEENVPTNKWPLGRIIDLYYGSDKKVRVVQVKTQGGTFKRAISKICVLPMPD
jgi:hypothetical protein